MTLHDTSHVTRHERDVCLYLSQVVERTARQIIERHQVLVVAQLAGILKCQCYTSAIPIYTHAHAHAHAHAHNH